VRGKDTVHNCMLGEDGGVHQRTVINTGDLDQVGILIDKYNTSMYFSNFSWAHTAMPVDLRWPFHAHLPSNPKEL
jgi:hypothetical protein